uniref:SWIM-type domain-containing protein n=1 Tax=Chenopodium quinoa TaxID=63459 RepID=A0A803MHP7_CHEQI
MAKNKARKEASVCVASCSKKLKGTNYKVIDKPSGRKQIKSDVEIPEFLQSPEKDGWYHLYLVQTKKETFDTSAYGPGVGVYIDSEIDLRVSSDLAESRVKGEAVEKPLGEDELLSDEDRSDNDTFVVNLENNTRGCYRWTLMGISCWHALACIQLRRLNYEDYIHPAYHVQTYAKTHAPAFRAMSGQSQWEVTPYPKPLPPPHGVMPGRPSKKKRVKEPGEDQERENVKRTKKQNKCGRCGGLGHYKTKCFNPIMQKVPKRKGKNADVFPEFLKPELQMFLQRKGKSIATTAPTTKEKGHVPASTTQRKGKTVAIAAPTRKEKGHVPAAAPRQKKTVATKIGCRKKKGLVKQSQPGQASQTSASATRQPPLTQSQEQPT